VARDTDSSGAGRHRRGRRAKADEELLAPLPGGLPPRAPWRKGKDRADENWTPVPPRGSTARPVGATPVPGLVPGGFVRPLPKAGAGTALGSARGNVLTLTAPPSLDALVRLDSPSPFETQELLDPLADVRRRGVAVVAGVVTGAVTLPPMLGMSAAGAAIEPKPNPTAAVTLPTGVEAFSPYLGQVSCDPHAKPGVVAFSELVLSYWGHGGSYGITRACNVGAQSEHKEGRAWDFKLNSDDYADQVVGQRVIDWLLADDAVNARRLGIMYIIWNERIWATYQREDGWRPYHGPDNHTSHIHFSFSWAGAEKRTSWWTGTVAPIEYGPCQKYIGTAVPIYGNTINLAPCPKPKARPKPKPADNKGNDNKGKNDGNKPDKPVTRPTPKPAKDGPGDPAPKPTYKVIRVKSGQTLGGIAHRNHTSVHRIVKLNHLKSANRIFVGQRLRVPAAAAKAVTAKAEHAVRIVTVKAGDTLGGLAIRYDTTVPAIVRANNLKSADHIYPGQKLRLP
jgi:LysM repeat protein